MRIKRVKKDINNQPINKRLMAALILESFVVILVFAVCVYGVGNMAFGKFVYFGYLIVGVALLVLAVGLNGGFGTKLPEPEDIAGNLTMEERVAFIEKIRRRKELAKKVVFMDFPFLCCLLLDTLYVMLPTGGLF